MARPREEGQQIKAFALFTQGVRKTGDIQRALESDVGSEAAVSKRTVERWLQGFREMETSLDKLFDWSLMPEYGLEWEASSYVLEMWRLVTYEGLIFVKGDMTPGYWPPTGRQVRWWWRVHQVVPEVCMRDVFWLSQPFVHRELCNLVLAHPLDMTDSKAHLSYRPWEGWYDDATQAGIDRKEAYLKAIEDGRIPRLPKGSDSLGNLIKLGDRASGLVNTPPLGGYSQYPWLLHTQHIELHMSDSEPPRAQRDAEKTGGDE